MNRISKKLLMAIVVVVVITSSCGKYEDGPNFSLVAKKSRVTGQWELVSVIPGGTPNGVTIIWEVEKDGDFKWSYEYGSYNYTVAGTWEFEDQNENFEVTVDNVVQEFKILRLTNKEFNVEYTYGGQTTEMRFEKQ